MVEQITILELALIDPPEEMAREFVDPDKVRELAESIREVGLQEPIIVRPRNSRYEIVAGHRRSLAHQLLGKLQIDTIVRELTDEQVLLIRAIENDQRVDLNPIERARNYQRLKDRFGWTESQIGQKVGRHRNTIRNYLDLLDTPEEFQSAIAKGLMAMDVARTLNKIEDPSFRKYYFESAVRNGVTVEVAELWVSEWHKARIPAAQGGDGGGGVDLSGQSSLPIFTACCCCLMAVDVKEVKYIPVCANCAGQIKGALKPEKTK